MSLVVFVLSRRAKGGRVDTAGAPPVSVPATGATRVPRLVASQMSTGGGGGGGGGAVATGPDRTKAAEEHDTQPRQPV